MSESAYALYTPYKPVAGGRARARTARRDKFGRFLPNDSTKALPPPLKHGQAGGKKRAQTGKKNYLGQFVRDIQIGSRYLFEYHCWESEESQDAELWHHTDQEVIIIRELPDIDVEVGRMFEVRFLDGFIYSVFEDELIKALHINN